MYLVVLVVLYFHSVQETRWVQVIQLLLAVLSDPVLLVVQGILDLQVDHQILFLRLARVVLVLHGDPVLHGVRQFPVDLEVLEFPVGLSLPDVRPVRAHLVDLVLRTGHPGLVHRLNPTHQTKPQSL